MPAIEHPLSGGERNEEGILQSFLELDTPPGGSHENAFAVLTRQFIRESEFDVDVSGAKGLVVPSGHHIPVGTVCPVGRLKDTEPWEGPTGVFLVFEITSGNPTRDREAKRRGYAAAGIPCLLIDRSDLSSTLFTSPRTATTGPT